MKLLNYIENGSGKPRLGVRTENGVLDVAAAASAAGAKVPVSMREALEGGAAALESFVAGLAPEAAKPYLKDEADLSFGPCVTDPGKIICIGLNYRRHAEETNMPIPAYPILFNKFNNTLNGHGHDVPLPCTSAKVDYEAELGIVIGKTAKYVGEDEALDYVFGYCSSNDLSARDLQMRTSQWLAGKSCDGFSPIGPYLVTADEVGDPNDLYIRCTVNGELRQNSHTSDMIFDCKQIVSYVSQCMTLSPGDIILTGTPEGVVMGYPEDKQVYLRPGDVVTVEIEKLGAITNRMVAERD
ncbi:MULTISPECIES: fumarylacetoacetate hydrolase family protein [Cohnella]|uniref:fumarylacetoacetate hydrolase family protein n=1 Tax=Cohnella TaxID=329857 RepID=UPI0009BA3A5C|nr:MULTISPECIES: fumarylacetoacetate hydrolase family protein [Cohnella]MBN2984896.1 fumarylacetoacetate hydrolase family protein [Cohnella algarum]